MATVYDADIQKSIEKLSDSMKSVIIPPEWSKFVKTSAGKERPPADADWYYKRAASLLITIYKRGPVGVSKLRIKYGTKGRRGHNPARFYRASGKIIRNVMQQLDKAGLTQFKKDGVKKGRIVTPKGRSLVDKNTIVAKNEQ